MTKVDIFSGFLGAGKTTLIKKLIREAYSGEKLVLIENEFGEIGIDGGFMQDAGIAVSEINSGCICCSLVGDFTEALKKVIAEYAPDRILIEPSGVGKLSDVIRAVQKVDSPDMTLNTFTTVVDAGKCKMYMKNFGEFFNDQIEHANAIILSHTGTLSAEKVEAAVAMIREHNATASIIVTDWEALDGRQILTAMEKRDTLADELEKLRAEGMHAHDDEDDEDDDDECCHHDHEDGEHHHHHHYDENGECACGHHHDDDDDDDDDDECCHHDHGDGEHHHHHHYDENGECACGHHHDDDDDDDDECCHHDHGDGEHHHHHHHHHHADEVFVSWGVETTKRFTAEEIAHALSELEKETTYGLVLRAKGIVAPADGSEWIHFDYVPGTPDVRHGCAATIGRLCVIGSKLNEEAIAALFGVK